MCISTGWSSSRGSRRKDGRRLHLPNMPGKGQQDDQVSQGGHWKEGTRHQVPNLPGKSPATNIHVSSLPHHLLCMWSQGPKMSRVQGGTSNSPVEVIFFICPFLIFLLILWAPFFICPGTGMLRKLPWTWKTCCNNLWNLLEMIQRKKLKGHLVIIKFRILSPLMIKELSFDDVDWFYKINNFPKSRFLPMINVYSAGPRLEPLSALQTTFMTGRLTFSNCSLLHKLLITGQGKQVVSRRWELDRDLLSRTCEYKYGSSKVSYRVGLKCRLEIEILWTYWNQKT